VIRKRLRTKFIDLDETLHEANYQFSIYNFDRSIELMKQASKMLNKLIEEVDKERFELIKEVEKEAI